MSLLHEMQAQECCVGPPASPPLRRYSELEDRGEILEKLLCWRHLVPTAPDTLCAYPYQDDDPFILTASPHVLFAGNQPDFATRLVAGPEGQAVRLCASCRVRAGGVAGAAYGRSLLGWDGSSKQRLPLCSSSRRGFTPGPPLQVRVVAVPKFSTTGTLVLVNLSTLACHPIKFDAAMDC